jgi:hypothetical protein
MHCANPDCRVTAEELMKGTLKLLEFDTPPEERIRYSSGGFPVCSAKTRYFWLCEKCSYLFTVKKWNSSGVILERRITSDLPFVRNSNGKPTAADIRARRRSRPLFGAA